MISGGKLLRNSFRYWPTGVSDTAPAWVTRSSSWSMSKPVPSQDWVSLSLFWKSTTTMEGSTSTMSAVASSGATRN